MLARNTLVRTAVIIGADKHLWCPFDFDAANRGTVAFVDRTISEFMNHELPVENA